MHNFLKHACNTLVKILHYICIALAIPLQCDYEAFAMCLQFTCKPPTLPINAPSFRRPGMAFDTAIKPDSRHSHYYQLY